MFFPNKGISPNPATDELTVTFERGNSSSFDIYIYDITGNCVLTHKNISQTRVAEKRNFLPPGYYVLKLTDGRSLSAAKGFIIAR